MGRWRRIVAFLVASLAVAASASAGAGEVPLGDVKNPRNVRFTGRVIEFVGDSQQNALVGDPPTWPPRTEVRWMVGALPAPDRARGPTETEWGGAAGVTWTIDGRPVEPREERREFKMSNGMTASIAETYASWIARPGRHVVVATSTDDRCATVTDALRVRLLVERATYDDGVRRFGSFSRRFRKSLDDLNALLEASVHPSAPQGVVDRFRVVDGAVYRRVEGPERVGFAQHPTADVAVACDQGGPTTGPRLVEHAIGWTAAGVGGEGDLWSATGEQVLWRDLLRLRGIPDYGRYAAAEGALPGRSAAGLALPQRWATDLMASPAQPARISELTALLANSNTGVFAVGDPDDAADARFGRTWRWIPPRLDLVVSDGGTPAAGAVVRWWRSLPSPLLPPHLPQGVAADRAPDGTATADATGKVSIVGDYLGSRAPLGQRSLWLLVEVERAGVQRFEIVYGLDLNYAYARGDKFFTTIRWDLRQMLVPDGPVPACR